MKKIISLIAACLVCLTMSAQVDEPENNIGLSLSSLQQKYPELRFVKSDEKGDQYMDGYKKDNMATFFYVKDNQCIEETVICESTTDAPYAWYKSKVALFDQKYYSAGRNIVYGKEYSFSHFRVKLICVTAEGIQTAMLIYEKSNGENRKPAAAQPVKTKKKKEPKKKVSQSVKESNNMVNVASDGSDIYYTESPSDVYGMEAVGEFTASSPLKKVYIDAFRAAIKKIQKEAAKKGVTKLLITEKTGVGSLKVKIKATGYR